MSDRPSPSFTMRELLEEISGMETDIELGEKLTTREIMDILGLGSMQAARRRLRPLVISGLLVPGKKRQKNIAGVETSVPAYYINPTATWEQVMEVLEG